MVFEFTGVMGELLKASHHELEDVSVEITRIRKEMSTTREIVSRMHVQNASVDQLSPFLMPLNQRESNEPDDLSMAGAAAALNPSSALLGGDGMAPRSSVSDLIRLGSVRSVARNRGPCDLPLTNTFSTSRF